MDVEANLPPRRGYTHKLRTRVRGADIQICFNDVVSLEAYSGDKNMFIGNGRIYLSPENLKPFWSALVSDRFQFMKAGIGGHDSIDYSRVRRDDRFREAQEVLEESGLWSIGFQVLLSVHGLSTKLVHWRGARVPCHEGADRLGTLPREG